MLDSPDRMSMAEHEDDRERSDGGEDRGSPVQNGGGSVNGKGREDNDKESEDEEEEDDVEDEDEEQEQAAHAHEHSGPEDAGEEELDDEYDEEDDAEYDVDDDEEPALKYERLGGMVHDLLVKDSASILAYSHQRLVRLESNACGDANHSSLRLLAHMRVLSTS